MKNVVIAGVSGAIGEALADTLSQRTGVRVWGLCRRPEQVHSESLEGVMRWDALEDAGRWQAGLTALLPAEVAVDTVIYAAGVLQHGELVAEKRLEDLEQQALMQAFQVNAAAFPLLIKALSPWLRHRQFKRLVAVSAKVGAIGDNHLGGWYSYRASKAALNMLVKNLAVELPRRHSPVACVAVHPGTTLSPLSEPFAASLARLDPCSPAVTAERLTSLLDDLTEQHNGSFLNWNGNTLPW
ncbi:MAG: SDR family NAD(P)-dependent oxidoreductase [Marinobacter sp.]|nr:SDR family NAD(P)-dependent oxidoreductase [Marinobacter sp.]